jgi:hypothetical protein
MVIHDQPRTALSGQECPNPLQEHADPKTDLRQKREVDSGPGELCNKASHSKFAALQNGKPLTDNGHITFVEISKRLRGVLAGNASGNQFPDVAPLLHRYLGNAG